MRRFRESFHSPTSSATVVYLAAHLENGRRVYLANAAQTAERTPPPATSVIHLRKTPLRSVLPRRFALNAPSTKTSETRKACSRIRECDTFNRRVGAHSHPNNDERFANVNLTRRSITRICARRCRRRIAHTHDTFERLCQYGRFESIRTNKGPPLNQR